MTRRTFRILYGNENAVVTLLSESRLNRNRKKDLKIWKIWRSERSRVFPAVKRNRGEKSFPPSSVLARTRDYNFFVCFQFAKIGKTSASGDVERCLKINYYYYFFYFLIAPYPDAVHNIICATTCSRGVKSLWHRRHRRRRSRRYTVSVEQIHAPE